ncbi:MAG: zinc ribbon domain-containing protein [Gammaproteobacteria bacterium]|jgi:putative FmdB family regulatory protein|nr:zinc ribbon domain-containing protein [Gammaproteobacteria bacterium]
MPTYDYQCTRCGSRLEARHAIGATPPACDHCGGRLRRMLLQAPAMHGFAARGRDAAARSLPECGKGCRCCP